MGHGVTARYSTSHKIDLGGPDVITASVANIFIGIINATGIITRKIRPISLPTSTMYPTGPRKKPEEYSTNRNTMRARARKARLDPYTRELEAAQASDSKAITRQLTTVACQKEYQEASPEVREEMLQQAEKEVMARR